MKFDKEALNELALFAGAGGGILGGHLLGWRTVCAVEWEPYPAAVLAQRQNDGFLDPFPIWDDVRTFDGRPWRGIVDVVSGGFPCQDISVAGKGDGLDGARSGLWKEMVRIIGEVGPRFVLMENSPALATRGGERITAKLAQMGYVGRNGVLAASDAGAAHERQRIWFVANAGGGRGSKNELRPGWDESGLRREELAYPDGQGQLQPQGVVGEIGGRPGNGGKEVPNTNSERFTPRGIRVGTEAQLPEADDSSGGNTPRRSSWWDADPAELPDPYRHDGKRRFRPVQMGRGWSKEETERALAFGRSEWGVESRVGRVAYGVAARVDRLKAIGNGQVPDVVELAWETLK